MNKLKLKCCKAIANMALAITDHNVNSACMFMAYQPRLPKEADKLKRVK